jgi:dipeptidyl aminopeptidase/acylaminoacyl peptidase
MKSPTFLFSTIILAASIGSLHATSEKPPVIPVTDFFDNPKISSATISPDGKRLAFLGPEEGFMNVWVCGVGEDFASARPVTHDHERGIFSFTWTRDGAAILYEQDQDGNENFHLYRVDPDKPKEAAVDLTPMAGTRARIIDLPQNEPGIGLLALNVRDKHYFDAYRLDLKTGNLTMLEQNPGDVDAWYADWDGKIRACVAQISGGRTQIRVRDSDKGAFHELATYTDEESASIEGWGADNSFLYVSDARGSNTVHLAKLDLKTGRETIVSSDPHYDLGGALISDRTRRLLAATYEKDRLVYEPFNPQIARDLEFLRTVHDGDILLRSSDDSEKKWIVAYNSPTDPGATYLFDRETGKAEFLYRPRPWLKADELVTMKPVVFKSRDGLDLHGYLTVPKGIEPKNLPAVLIVHGGPWARDEWGYDPEVQFLANRGFAVLQINFRGSTGYGKTFLHAGDKEWGGKMLDDLVDGVNWLVKEGVADPKRLGIYGGSYGGYATLSAVAFHPDVFACAVDYVGISNLLTFMNTIPPYWETFRDVMYRRVGDPVKDADFLRSRSPLFFADQIKAPLFIAQGYNDPRVNRAEAEQIVAALKKNGKPVEYLVKMDEGHGFENPKNRIEFYTKMEAFLARYLNLQ